MVRIARSALRHGVAPQDIVAAMRYAQDVMVLREDPSKWLYLGFNRSGVPLEIISVVSEHDGDELVIHAMTRRKILWEGESS